MKPAVETLQVLQHLCDTGDMPNQPKTPIRGMRIPGDIWEPAQRRAAHDDTTVTAVVVAYLKRYGKDYRDQETPWKPTYCPACGSTYRGHRLTHQATQCDRSQP